MKIHYEPHPVSAQRKAELRANGHKIVDARFAPSDWKPHAIQQTEDEAEAPAPAPVNRRAKARKV